MEGSKSDDRIVFQFIEELRSVLSAAEAFLERDDLAPGTEELCKASIVGVEALRKELGEVEKRFETDAEARESAGQALEIANSVQLMKSQTAVAEAADNPEDTAGALGAAFDWGKVGVDKILEFLPDNPLKKFLKDVSILLPQLKKLLVTVADKVAALTLDVAEIEAKVERFLHQVIGRPLPKNVDEKGAARIPGVSGPVEEPELQGSVLWFLWDIERKLEYLWKRVEGENYPRSSPDSLITPMEDDAQDRGAPIGKEIDDLCQKLECLIRFLGLTLYNVEWDCTDSLAPDPPDPPDGDLHPLAPDGHRHPRATPPESIKDELHEIEKCLDEIKECLDILKRPDIPPEDPPEDPAFFADLKRIRVYEEDVFAPAGPGDSRLIEVRSAAFDLAGWIDLTGLQDGDSITIGVHVNLPGGVRRLYRESRYAGAAEARLYSLHDAVGPTILVGNAVDVEIRQDDSSGLGLAVPYQLVVESQRLRT